MRNMTVGDLRRALEGIPEDVVVSVEGCVWGCTSGILSVELEARRDGNVHQPLRVTIVRGLI